eukprot:gb/GECG01016040.1/.p1 GENE.gb/GECG01016040.1/~~gb/GECG01016040.1/.p1  ORF type:complete len:178 (+),score=21.20 gb/GECG01016040.1/:1-534(+)
MALLGSMFTRGALRRPMTLARMGGTTGPVRCMAEEASATTEELRVNLAVPHTSLVANAEVKRVTLPGRGGAYGLEKNSPAMVSELRPGLVQIDYPEGNSDKYFIPGGFCFMHKDNKVDVTVPEGVRLEDIDTERVRELNQQAVSKRDSAQAGSKEAAEAIIEIEVYKSLAHNLGMSL